MTTMVYHLQQPTNGMVTLHNQFWEGVRTKDLIDTLKPKLILEMGFGAGTNMLMMLSYTKKPGNDYRIISLSDDSNLVNITLPNDFVDRFMYIRGISYAMINRWKDLNIPRPFDGTIDFCIIDTDHNYYTLKKELENIDTIMSSRCAIAMHDTASKPCEHHLYYENALNKESNSMMKMEGTYLNDDPYPSVAVAQTMELSMMQAIDEFLIDHPDFKKIKHLDECCGCTVISRDFDYV